MIEQNEFENRIEKLIIIIKEKGLDAFIVSDSESIYYYTGASYKVQERPFFIIFWPENNPTFLVPQLEKDHMEKASIGDVVPYWEYPAPEGLRWQDKISEILKDTEKIGIEPSISLMNRDLIVSSVPSANIEAIPLVDNIRLVKSVAEIEMIRDASRYSDEGMGLMIDNAYYGVSVLEMFSLSKKIQLKVIKTGFFDPLQTEFLTACWPAPFSAKPHGVPLIDMKLKEGPLVAMSYLRVNGYAAECERTFFLSEPTEEQKKIFEDMRGARKKAFDAIKPGMKCSDVDKAALDFLKEKGYGDNLLHRTGHGIGMGNHEGPWVAEGSDHILEEGMIISVEPGIYLPEMGGFRHSDTVLITKDGYELLTKYPMDIESLTIKKSRIFKKLKGKIIQKAVGMK